MRRWPLGPIVAAIWFVLCGVYLLRVLGWETFTDLTPLDQLLYAALALLPVPVFWGVALMRRRAQEFSAVSAKLVDQLEAFEIRHVLREKNREADRLANVAMDRGIANKAPAVSATEVGGVAAVVQELNGVVRDGVVHFTGAPLPDGTLVKMRPVKP